MSSFKVPYAKELLFLGIALLIIGSLVIGIFSFWVQSETVVAVAVDVTTRWRYYSEGFRAESGDWLELDISSSGISKMQVIGQTVGEVFLVNEGTTYKYAVQIYQDDVYEIRISWGGSDNHISGDFYLKRTPTYFFQIMASGAVLLTVGILMIPSIIYLEHRARQIAKSLYECPRCKKEVRIGLEVCPYCKLDLTKYWIRCKYCNKFYDSHLEKCPKCGAETEI